MAKQTTKSSDEKAARAPAQSSSSENVTVGEESGGSLISSIYARRYAQSSEVAEGTPPKPARRRGS